MENVEVEIISLAGPGASFSLLLRKLSLRTVPLFFITFLMAQGCATLSSNIAKIPAPRVLPPENSIPKRTIIGYASWYGPGFNGKKTANGETFDETRMTAAHRTLPLGSKAKVTNLKNGKSVEVEINDRGPYARGRMIDLSHAAAKALGIVDGTATVTIEPLENSVSIESAKQP